MCESLISRSKSQYVRQLGQWGFTKYSKGTTSFDWKVASYKVAKAKKKHRNKTVELRRCFDRPVTAKVLRTQGFLTSSELAAFTGTLAKQTCFCPGAHHSRF
jgi:hypothetical protein